MKPHHKLLYGLLYVLSLMPFWLLYLLADVVYVLMYYLTGYRKKVVMDNMRRSFPNASPAQLQRMVKDFYHNLADVTLESLKAISVSEAELRKRVVFTNPDMPDGYTLQGITTLSLTSHKCNWEWLLLAANLNFKHTPVDALYKPLTSEFVDALMLKVRSRFGAYMVADTQVLRELAKRKTHVRTIAMVADQTPAQEAPHKFMFLNQPTLFFAGPEKIGVTLQAPVLFADMNRVKRGHYTVTYYHVQDPPYDKANPGIVAGYVKLCEEAVLKQPHNWLWSHKRWKHKVTWP